MNIVEAATENWRAKGGRVATPLPLAAACYLRLQEVKSEERGASTACSDVDLDNRVGRKTRIGGREGADERWRESEDMNGEFVREFVPKEEEKEKEEGEKART